VKRPAVVAWALLLVACTSAGNVAKPTATAAASAPAIGELPLCGAGSLSFLTIADGPAVSPGSTTRITAAVRNASNHACSLSPGDVGNPGVVITDASNRVVWDTLHWSPPGPFALPMRMEPATSFYRVSEWNLVPGEYQGSPLWGPPIAAAGFYRARASWENYPGASIPEATFSIEAPASPIELNPTQPRCGSSSLAVLALMDQPAYRVGDKVKITVALLNQSTQSCVATVDCTEPGVQIFDASHRVVWDTLEEGPPCPRPAPFVLNPGESFTSVWTWDQVSGQYGSSLSGAQVHAGEYLAQGHLSSYPAARVTVTPFFIQPN